LQNDLFADSWHSHTRSVRRVFRNTSESRNTGFLRLDLQHFGRSRGGTSRSLNVNELRNIGEPARNRGIRQVNGTETDARSFFDNQVSQSTVQEVQPGVFVGQGVNGITYTYRAISSALSNHVPTIDINGISGLRKMKFLGD
jgi:hypothetical protein